MTFSEKAQQEVSYVVAPDIPAGMTIDDYRKEGVGRTHKARRIKSQRHLKIVWQKAKGY